MQARRGELEETILTRVYGIGDASSVTEARYLDGLRRAVSAAVEYGLMAIEIGADQRTTAISQPVLAQARLAAHSGLDHGTVLARHGAANLLFADAVIEEADAVGLSRIELERLFRALVAGFKELLAAISAAFVRVELAPMHEELERRMRSAGEG
jgi:hypothetical protein